MPTREAMDSLAHEIIESYETRGAGLAALRSDVGTQRRATQALLEEMDVTHLATAQQLRVGLAKGQADLAGGVAAQITQLDAAHRAITQELRAGLAKGHADLAGGVAAQITQLDGAHRAMTQELRTGLAKGHSDLAGGVAAQLTQLDGAHHAMTQELRAGLAKGHSDLAGGVAAQLTQLDGAHHAITQELRAGLAKGHSDLAGGVAAQLTQLDAAHQTMTQELRSHLAEARSGLVRTEGSRKSRIRTWIHGVAATHAGARDAWQNLAAIMQEKRAAPTSSDGAPVPLYLAGRLPASPGLPAGQAGETMEIPVEEAAGNGEEDGSLAILANSAFAYLADHPDGARLANLEKELGLGRFQMNRVVRRLTDRGKVEKRDLLYFAI